MCLRVCVGLLAVCGWLLAACGASGRAEQPVPLSATDVAGRLDLPTPAAGQPVPSFRLQPLGSTQALGQPESESYQQAAIAAIQEDLSRRTSVAAAQISIQQVSTEDVASGAECGEQPGTAQPAERVPGLVLLASDGEHIYRYVASGMRGWFCGKQT